MSNHVKCPRSLSQDSKQSQNKDRTPVGWRPLVLVPLGLFWFKTEKSLDPGILLVLDKLSQWVTLPPRNQTLGR